jgi:hypothetical protein
VTDPEIARLVTELAAANARVGVLSTELQKARASLRKERAARQRQSEQLREMRTSLSWRLTYPIRMLHRSLVRKKY